MVGRRPSAPPIKISKTIFFGNKNFKMAVKILKMKNIENLKMNNFFPLQVSPDVFS